MDYEKLSIAKHKEWRGKIGITPKAKCENAMDLSLAYTPGVAGPCLEIQKDPSKSFIYTNRGNLCLVITDGTAVLGLGDIGPEAGMPVMEGKCLLFKDFGNVDAFPLCVKTKDVDEIVRTVELISGSFGGVNLEDIAAPRCFEIEAKLKERLNIPVFHDDQHGTAVVVLAGLLNALKLTGKDKETVRVVINGAGAAGLAVCKLLLSCGFKDITLVDVCGIINGETNPGLNPYMEEMSHKTNLRRLEGGLKEAMAGTDVFLGFSRPGLVTAEMVKSMNGNPIVFACANPGPEIFPEEALKGGAAVVATGRSDFPNQINNVLVFPGLFRGALDAGAEDITPEMKVAAAYAIAGIIPEEDLRKDYIIPDPFDRRVAQYVAKAVADAWKNRA